jgi:hypothetical protein
VADETTVVAVRAQKNGPGPGRNRLEALKPLPRYESMCSASTRCLKARVVQRKPTLLNVPWRFLRLHLILVVLRVDRRHAKLTWCTGKVNPPCQGGQYHSFADSSWADVLPSPKSTNNYDIFYNNAVVSWKTKLSAIIATSSTEAELSVLLTVLL